jgi:serine/threonine protein kinase
MRVEARIYEMIGPHPRVPRMATWDPQTCCLTMEYLEKGNLKRYIQDNAANITSELRRRWTKQATEGLNVLHTANIVHCDISPRNFLLDHDLDLKIADFGGASLSGSAPSAVAGTRFRYPISDWDAPPSFEKDIFGLGSLIYYIMTSTYPFADIPSDEVKKLFKSHAFPDVTHLPCGTIIKRCWDMEVTTTQVFTYLETLEEY